MVWSYTRFLSDADATAAANSWPPPRPGLRADLLGRRAARLEMKLDPEGVQRREDEARADGQRVEARREASGNSCLSGRELAIEDALASMAFIDAPRPTLRRGGLPGTLQELRALVFNDRTQGRDPWTGSPAPAPLTVPRLGAAGPARQRAGSPAAATSARCPSASPVATRAAAAATGQAATTARTPATATATMTPAGTAAPTCPNGSTSAAVPPRTTTTRTMLPPPRQGRRRRSRR